MELTLGAGMPRSETMAMDEQELTFWFESWKARQKAIVEAGGTVR